MKRLSVLLFAALLGAVPCSYGDEMPLAEAGGDPAARFAEARRLRDGGDRDGAIRLLESLSRQEPGRPEIFNNLAVLYAEQGRLDEARSALLRVFSSQPVYATAFANLKEVNFRLASRAYAKALDTPPAEEPPPRLALIERLPGPPPMVVATAQPTAAVAATRPAAVATAKPAGRPAESGVGDPARDRTAVIRTLTTWSSAWARQDVATYLAQYTDDYRPDDLSRREWLEQRRERLRKPGFIEIEVGDPQVRLLGPAAAEVIFDQRYRADHYHDQVRKRLAMVKTRKGWRISAEESLTP